MSKVCKRCGQSLRYNGLTIYINKHTGRTTEKHESYCKACKKIVRAEYEHALQRYNGTPESLHRIETIEDDLLSYYYSILVLQSLDLRRYCINKRKAYGIGVYTKAQDIV